jgi:hypothetical protein
MTIDRYTRAVLTIIAAALVWLCVILTPAGTPLSAQVPADTSQPATRVVIAGWEGTGPRLQGSAGGPPIVTYSDLRVNPLPTSAAK